VWLTRLSKTISDGRRIRTVTWDLGMTIDLLAFIRVHH